MICLAIPRLEPTDGGPPVVVQELSRALTELGRPVRIVTRGCREEGALPELGSVVHDFGLWLPFHHNRARACRKHGIRYINSPSGMLAPWALAHKGWKKRVAWWLYQARDLHGADALVASSEREHRQLRRLFVRKPIAIISHGVRLPARRFEPAEWNETEGSHSRKRKLVYLGRLHPVKGLLNLVRAWDQIRPAGWQCILAGPDSTGHKGEVVRLLNELNCAADFQFTGLLDENQKWELLHQASLFVLPSFSENFGLSAAEALTAGVPVITTATTPWEDLERNGCGWISLPTVEGLCNALREATAVSDQVRSEMGTRGREWVTRDYTWGAIAAQCVSLYEWVWGRATQPRFVFVEELHACKSGTV